MAGMLRLKDEKELLDLLKRTRVTICRGLGVDHNVRHVPEEPLKRIGRDPGPRAVTKQEREPSEIEELLAGQISACGNLPAPEREYHFLRGRAHRLDFAWPEWTVNGMQIGVEVQGMVHRVKGRFSADLEKRALGLLQDWLILEVGGEQIRSGKAMEWLQALFLKAIRRG